MKKIDLEKNLKTYNIFIYILLALFSFFYNFWVSNKGVFPIDTFLHYDSGNKILNGEIPIRDFWIIHGLALDYIQSIFFLIFGTNWISYIFHSSAFNCIITLFIFNFFQKFEINIIIALILSICFSILAYPVSGVPFIDHHSTFFSIIAFLLFYFAFKNSNNNYFFFIPFIFLLAFLSKPVPAAYFLIIFLVTLIIYIFSVKNFKILKNLFYGFFLCLIFLYFFLKGQNIPINLFLDQLIFYPLSIGEERFDGLFSAFLNRISNFKFLLLPILFLLLLFLFKKQNKLSKSDYAISTLIIIFTFTLIFHQLLTKNQNFIFFLIPMNVFLIIYVVEKINHKYKKFINFFFLVFTIILTFKYNERFNIDRKFHDLQNVDIKNYIEATMIDKTLYPLKWKTNVFSQSKEEINLINNLVSILNSSNEKILLVSNYNFLDAITTKKLYMVVKNYDDVTVPQKRNKYYPRFKKFFNNKLIDKEINEIIIFMPNRKIIEKIKSNFDELLGTNCYSLTSSYQAIISLKLKKC